MKHSLPFAVLISACTMGLMNQSAPGQTCNEPIPLIGDTVRIGPNTSAANDRYSSSIGISGDWAIGGAIELGNFDRGFAIVHYRNQGGLDSWGEIKRLTSPDSPGDQILIIPNSIQHISVKTAILTPSLVVPSAKEPRK